MLRRLPLLLVLAAGCTQPDDRSNPAFYADNLRDIYRWDPMTQAAGHFAYDTMVGSDPRKSVPVLIGKLSDTTPTGIHDALHDPVPVGNVAFHILLGIFRLRPEAFEREGVWVMKDDPSKNPIFMVHLDTPEVRARAAERFRKLAIERGWLDGPQE